MTLMRVCLICGRIERGKVTLRWRLHTLLHRIRGEHR